MRNGKIAFGLLIALVVSATTASAQVCGDANRTGTVTVTDGVLVLRAAADIPGTCPRERCDMNLDGRISVTDGVLALRLAAGVNAEVVCSAAQAGALFGQLTKSLAFGSVVSPAARGRAAATTTPCADGGFASDDGSTITFVDCGADGFVTNGSVSILDVADDVTVAIHTSDLIVNTGEVFDTDGMLTFTFGDATEVNGRLAYASSVLGNYSDRFDEVLVDDDFVPFFGQVTTTITDGRDSFANVSEFAATIYSRTLARIAVSYTDGAFDLFTFAEGLCEPCSSGCANESLTCVSCVQDCRTSGSRCGIDFDVLDCDDGFFGPRGVCDPCTTDDDCNGSEGLSCFACADNCTGDVLRCGSSKAFVECSDGAF
jgi:hypothetical protein